MATDDRWHRLETLFARAVSLSPEARRAYLDQLCRTDPALGREVTALLAAHDRHSGVIDDLVRAELVRAAGPAKPRIPGYRILRELGRGGMGVVFLARREKDQDRVPVAAKVLRGDCTWPDAERRIRVEAAALARLNHPNIAKLLDAGRTADDAPYFAMEYVPGDPINRFVARQSLTIDQRIGLFASVCRAVSHAHDRAVVHRDLKPTNILVTPDWSPKLLDFGIAKLLDPTGRGMGTTATGWALMTPQYASPEQIAGERATARTDVYALGVILYELLTGELPYRPAVASPFGWGEAVLNRPAIHPATYRPQLDDRVTSLLLTALEKDPVARTITAGEMAERLHGYLGTG